MEGPQGPFSLHMAVMTGTWAEKVASVRGALADEWAEANPRTPDEITAFYRNARTLADDLDAFHQLPQRQEWTDTLVKVAKQIDSGLIIDIGSGAGHDLRALRAAGVTAQGVEPNDALREACVLDGFGMSSDVSLAPIEDAAILNCIDVLEHVPDPESWLGGIAGRAKVGTLLLETCAVWDAGTPLHLPANRGWAPGRCLQSHGWDKIAFQDRMTVWKRQQAGPIHQTHIAVCASDSITVHTHRSVLNLMAHVARGKDNWISSEATEAGLLRARSVWMSTWYRTTCGDVCLLVDADIRFLPQDAMHLVQVARELRSIVVAAYPTKDGANLTIKPLMEEGQIQFGPDQPPIPIRWGATGFMAVHRDVMDALIPTLPLCNSKGPHSFWPIFSMDLIREDDDHMLLLDDFGLCERARDLGFTVWLDPTIMVDHMSGLIGVNYMNMDAVRALSKAEPD